MDDRSAPSPAMLARLLSPPEGPVQAVLDTDAYNEIDDQFALVDSVLSPRIELEAVYAAPFFNRRSQSPGHGMEKSYREIERLFGLLADDGVNHTALRLRGSSSYLPAEDRPVESPAAEDLVRRAMRPDRAGLLYVMAVGAPTNVASALLMEPRIRERVVVVWLGGHPPSWHTAREFNLMQDVHASRVLLNSGVPLVLVPCKNVAEHLRVSAAELSAALKGRGAVAGYLLDIATAYIRERALLSKVIWDIAVSAWLKDPALVPSRLEPSPILCEGLRWSLDAGRHLIRVAYDVDRDGVFRELYSGLGSLPMSRRV